MIYLRRSKNDYVRPGVEDGSSMLENPNIEDDLHYKVGRSGPRGLYNKSLAYFDKITSVNSKAFALSPASSECEGSWGM